MTFIYALIRLFSGTISALDTLYTHEDSTIHTSTDPATSLQEFAHKTTHKFKATAVRIPTAVVLAKLWE